MTMLSTVFLAVALSIAPVHTDANAEILAKIMYSEARGVESRSEQAAVAECILNRTVSDGWPDSIDKVVKQHGQFAWDSSVPVTADLLALAHDVLEYWDENGHGAVLPIEYAYFSGDGNRNHFRDAYRGGNRWDWSLGSHYDKEDETWQISKTFPPAISLPS